MTPKRLVRLAFWCLSVTACERVPTEGVREWKASDHDRAGNSGNAAVAPMGQPGAGPKNGGDAAGVAELAWRNQCASCHGPLGKGDGPTGPMVGATDLTTRALQSRLSDADIANTIKNGRGKMPKFDLPDEVVLGLVGKVRRLGSP